MDNYEWDPLKAQTNYTKHDVSFADAVMVFEDEQAITIEDDYPNEHRYITIGSDAFDRVLVVVYTYRQDMIRLISARKATASERRDYQEG